MGADRTRTGSSPKSRRVSSTSSPLRSLARTWGERGRCAEPRFALLLTTRPSRPTICTNLSSRGKEGGPEPAGISCTWSDCVGSDKMPEDHAREEPVRPQRGETQDESRRHHMKEDGAGLEVEMEPHGDGPRRKPRPRI